MELGSQHADHCRRLHADPQAVDAALLTLGVRCLPREAQVLVLDFDATDDPLAGITLSMSRTANSYDNALAERLPGTAVPALRAACGRLSRSARLVATLKAECFADFLRPTRAAAELMAFDSIETFCNPHRRHSSLGQRSPRDFESQMFPHNQNHTKPLSSLSKKDHWPNSASPMRQMARQVQRAVAPGAGKSEVFQIPASRVF
ncbi:MAG: hypothetical protein ABI464_15415 [Chthoniobacteraceae bacterium]